MLISSDECAREVLEVVPQMMRVIRTYMRSHSTSELSVPQFRTLAFLNRNPGVSLSDVAEHIGLTLPSMSKLIDGLVAQQLVAREISATDRRCITLKLTPLGQSTFQSARQATQIQLSQRLAALSETERATVFQAMQALRLVFTSENELDMITGR